MTRLSQLLARLPTRTQNAPLPGRYSDSGNRELYNHCAYTYGVNNTWIAFIDADEFFDTPNNETIEEILRDLEETQPKAGALGVNWQMHSSNHQLYHAESVRKTFLECIFDDPEHNGEEGGNKHVKSIVRVDAYSSPSKCPSAYLPTYFVNGLFLHTPTIS